MTSRPGWDVADPAFLVTVLRVMAGLAVLTVLAGVVLAPARWAGFVSGAAVALALYLTALQAGRVFLSTRRLGWVLFWLFGAQLLVWIAAAVLLGVLKVDPIGFVISVTVLPAGVIISVLYWWLVQRKGSLA